MVPLVSSKVKYEASVYSLGLLGIISGSGVGEGIGVQEGLGDGEGEGEGDSGTGVCESGKVGESFEGKGLGIGLGILLELSHAENMSKIVSNTRSMDILLRNFMIS